jgi:hypothetical protein
MYCTHVWLRSQFNVEDKDDTSPCECEFKKDLEDARWSEEESPLPNARGSRNEHRSKVVGTQAEIELYSSMPGQGQAARLIYKYTMHGGRGEVVACRWQCSTLGANVKQAL